MAILLVSNHFLVSTHNCTVENNISHTLFPAFPFPSHFLCFPNIDNASRNKHFITKQTDEKMSYNENKLQFSFFVTQADLQFIA